MDIYRFKTIANGPNAHFKIPFHLSIPSFDIWLNSLKNHSAPEQTNHVLYAIQGVARENKIPKQHKSLLLIHIYTSLLSFLVPLNTSILNSPLPLAQEESRNLLHIVTIYAELANGFANCIRKVSNLENAQTLFYGLRSLNCAYLQIAQVYQKVYPNFWRQSYLFYDFAIKLKLQDLIIEQHELHSNTIAKTFKHLLALHHCGLKQFRPRTMLTISDCADKHSSMMLIGNKFVVQKAAQYSTLDLQSDNPPSNLIELKQTTQGAQHFFSAYAAALEINKNAANEAPGTGLIKSINREYLLQAAKNLSLSEKRKFTRFNEETTRNGIIGFSHILVQLHKAKPLDPNSEKNKKSMTRMAPRISRGWPVPNISLVTDGYESIDALQMKPQKTWSIREQQSRVTQAIKNSQSKSIWATQETKPHNEKPTKLDEFHTVNISTKGYRFILDTAISMSKVHIGDIIAINNKDSLEIGNIFRLSQLTGNKLQLDIQLLGLGSEISYISLPEYDSINAWAIFLPGIKTLKTADSIIFNDSKFQCGEFITLKRFGKQPVSYRLNKLLHLNFAATHIELFNPNETA